MGGDAGGKGAAGSSGCASVCATATAIQARGLAFDNSRRLIYVSVNGSAPTYPNTITAVDPATGAVVWSIPVGSDPNLITLSDDASTLWVGLDGAYSITKVTLDTVPPTVWPAQSLPQPSTFSIAALVTALVPVPGVATSVVAVVTGEGLSEVTILDDGLPRLNSIRSNTAPTLLAEGPPGYVFGLGSIGTEILAVIGILAGGPSIATYSGLLSSGGQPLYQAGRLYFSGGEIVDVTNIGVPTRIGAFAYSGSMAVRSAERLMMLAPPPLTPQGASATLRILETETFTQTASVAIPGSVSSSITGSVGHLIYAGGDTVAFTVTSDLQSAPQLVLAHAAIVESPP